MTTAKELVAEVRLEAETTRKVLERILKADLSWKPHDRSMTIGRLGMHIAELPNWIVRCLEADGYDFGSAPYNPVVPDTHTQLMQTFETTIEKAVAVLNGATDEALVGNWTLRRGGAIIVQSSRQMFIRRQLNHLVHHRGQLSVYLRLLNVPVPSMYGPSADEKT